VQWSTNSRISEFNRLRPYAISQEGPQPFAKNDSEHLPFGNVIREILQPLFKYQPNLERQ
jgi:hypothetical protein